jgi:cobalt-precorrin 5A hydrolase
MIAPASKPILVIGLGCRRGCPLASLRELIDSSLERVGLDIQAVTALASIDLKSTEPGLIELSETLGVPFVLFSAEELSGVEGRLSHRSQASFEATGCYGVAESAALMLASRLSDAPARLAITREKNSHATFALAERVPL